MPSGAFENRMVLPSLSGQYLQPFCWPEASRLIRCPQNSSFWINACPASLTKHVLRVFLLAFTALVLTIASAWINPVTDERAMYGSEGPVEQNYLPRKVGGWPAPYLADSTATSVPHNVGLEDDFRPGPFVATFCFWYVALMLVSAFSRKARQRLIGLRAGG